MGRRLIDAEPSFGRATTGSRGAGLPQAPLADQRTQWPSPVSPRAISFRSAPSGPLGALLKFERYTEPTELQMKRREFIAGLGVAGAYAAVPCLARAQQGPRMWRLAILVAGEENQVVAILVAAFRNELAKLGWVEGRNLQIDVRYGQGDVDRMRANAAELVGLAPDVIFSGGASMAAIVQQQTQTIPIVTAFANDMLASGLVKNLAHPEGNTTGVTNLFAPIAGKWVELLKEAVPWMERLGYLYNLEPYQEEFSRYIEQASRVLGIRMTDIPFHNAVDLARGINAFAAEPNGGLVISPLGVNGKTANTLTIQYRLPAIYGTFRGGFDSGLIFYGARGTDIVVRTASLVDRILRGAKPRDLPVEYPTRFELVVNLKIAKAIGVTIPEAFLARADEVIE
jgi:putative tryptophan/tyrosine transport system substrate-binding protein